jgi:hypothetical protein
MISNITWHVLVFYLAKYSTFIKGVTVMATKKKAAKKTAKKK